MGRLGLALLLAPALRAADDRTCADDHENCEFWASQGECFDNPSYMRTHCALSCESCASYSYSYAGSYSYSYAGSYSYLYPCADYHETCLVWATHCLTSDMFLGDGPSPLGRMR